MVSDLLYCNYLHSSLKVKIIKILIDNDIHFMLNRFMIRFDVDRNTEFYLLVLMILSFLESLMSFAKLLALQSFPT